MSLFHENIRLIFAELEKFLNETLKKEAKLSKKTLEHKQLIQDKLLKFYEENPEIGPVSSQEPAQGKESDESSATGGSEDNASADQNYIDAGIGLIGAGDLKEPAYSGFLEKKQKKGTGLFGGKFQKRWCAIHAGVFYYFATPKDKQQHGAFQLEGYTFRNAADLSTKKNEKELCFELYHDDEKKRIYQFMAKSKTEYDDWKNILENGGKPLIEEDMYEEVGMERDAPKEETKVEVKVEEAIEEDVYEEPPEGPEQPKAPAPAPVPRGLPKIQPPAVPELPKVPPPPSPRTIHRPPPSLPDEPGAVTEELYDDALSEARKPGDLVDAPPRAPEVPLPRPPETHPPVKKGQRPQRDLPPPPPVKKKIKLNITYNPVEDFENRYYGKWDCEGGNSQELSFKKGDIIYILSREFDEKSWWVGELNGKFGLVPKNYLIPAYTPVHE